jgi:hypothetical protein
MVLMVLGFSTGLFLLPGPRHFGRVTLDVHTMLYAALAVILGFQAMVFAVFTKTFAIGEKLLPADSRLYQLFQYITLEVGLVVGALLILSGFGGSIYAVVLWSRQSFGPLETARVLRMVIPAVLSLALGFQVVFASFFMSVLGLKRK